MSESSPVPVTPVPVTPVPVTVVLPCFNELRHSYLPRILENLQQQRGPKQLIAVVSPSQDATRATLAGHGDAGAIDIVDAPPANRAQRLNLGIAASHSELVLLHHPATLLPPHTALDQVRTALKDHTWGGFHHSFDLDHWLLRFTSWYSNRCRARYGQILYLDHCIFARRTALERIGGVPNLDIFEDTALSQALQSLAPPVLAPGTVTTSARRFQQRGIYRHALLNQVLKLMYHAKLDPQQLNRLYERTAQINVSYSPPRPK